MQNNMPLTNGMSGDRADRLLEKKVHPEGRQNPQPTNIYNLVIVGAGPAGIVAARDAARLGAKVALIERHLLGGTSLNTGSIPSKSIIRSSRLYGEMFRAEDYGGKVPGKINIDFQAVMERMRKVRARISSYNSLQRLTEAGIDVFFGCAQFTGPRSIAVDGKELRFKKALIATGFRSLRPSIPGLAEAGFLTNDTFFNLNECPRRLLIIGGGPLGCEAAQAFCRLGAQVTIVQNEPMFLPKEERDAAQLLSDALVRDGIEIHLNTVVVSVRTEGKEKIAECVTDEYKFKVSIDEIVVGIGRCPNVDGLNLEAAGVGYDSEKGILVNDFLQTSNRRIYAAGDICMEHKFTDAAIASARIAVDNALFFGRKRQSALTIPWCTYTDPEIAHVGLYVEEAQAKNIPVNTFTILMHDVDRAITDGEEEGFVKIHVKDGTDRILGATVVARHAGEMITGLTLAMTLGIGLRDMAHTIQSYPTQASAIKMAANAYERSRLTPILKFLAKLLLAW